MIMQKAYPESRIELINGNELDYRTSRAMKDRVVLQIETLKQYKNANYYVYVVETISNEDYEKHVNKKSLWD